MIGEDMLSSIRRRIDILGLDLAGLSVATEAATGAYACTAVIAALAGARVHAVARESTRYGTYGDALSATLDLAARAGVADRISVARAFGAGSLESCDIVTNSGAVRPISGKMIARLRRGAVIGLMFEAWEFREADLDLAACRRHGIGVAAVNERHPDIAVFDFLGPLCVRLLEDGGMSLSGTNIAVLCDNPFEPYLLAGVSAAGARVQGFREIGCLPREDWDAVVVAVDPNRNARLGYDELSMIASAAPGAKIAQFWGDIDRRAAADLGITSVCPAEEPAAGHMGTLLNALGHEPIVRLQAGGLRAAELLFRGMDSDGDGIAVTM
jgi:hypothetical protein